MEKLASCHSRSVELIRFLCLYMTGQLTDVGVIEDPEFENIKRIFPPVPRLHVRTLTAVVVACESSKHL